MEEVGTGMSGCQAFGPASRSVEIEAFQVHSAESVRVPALRTRAVPGLSLLQCVPSTRVLHGGQPHRANRFPFSMTAGANNPSAHPDVAIECKFYLRGLHGLSPRLHQSKYSG